MIVFTAEKKAGLEAKLQDCAYSSIKYDVPLTANTLKKAISEVVAKATAAKKDKDLYHLNSIMVTVGWNKNDDVFLKEVTWGARHTPEDKPFNVGHVSKDIIGHIVANYVVDEDGNVIAEDTAITDLPNKFHIVTNSVLYKDCWGNKEDKERVAAIIQEIEDGISGEKETKWYVSMECIFAGFDYAVIAPDGTEHLVARTEESAFLTEYLRAYDGPGEYQGYKIGRAIKNLAFSGLGLVEKPANPNSIIFDGVLSFRGNTASTVKELMETAMANSNESEKGYEALAAELQSKLEAMEKGLKEQIAKLEADVLKKADEVKVSAEKIGELNTKLESATKQSEILTQKLTEANDKVTVAEKGLADLKTEQTKASRAIKLTEKGLTKDEVESALANFATLDEKAFEAVLPFMKKVEAKTETSQTQAIEKLEAAQANTETTVPSVPDEAEKAKAEKIEKDREAIASDIAKAFTKQKREVNKK